MGNRVIEDDEIGGKSTRRSSRRSSKAASGAERSVKPKFQEERVVRINSTPLVPMNDLQKDYIRLISDKDMVIATGFAGTSKTYIPTVMACDAFLKGEIDRIFITRPNISNSKSLGFFGGDLVEKMSNWLGPVLSVMRDRLGAPSLEIAIKHGDIAFVPMEVIKGYSFGKNTFVLVDEAEDLTVDEAKKVVTRSGGCKMVLAGDILQSELKEKSGLKWLMEMLKKYPELQENAGAVDFNRPSDIVRSKMCRNWILAMRREGEM